MSKGSVDRSEQAARRKSQASIQAHGEHVSWSNKAAKMRKRGRLQKARKFHENPDIDPSYRQPLKDASAEERERLEAQALQALTQAR